MENKNDGQPPGSGRYRACCTAVVFRPADRQMRCRCNGIYCRRMARRYLRVGLDVSLNVWGWPKKVPGARRSAEEASLQAERLSLLSELRMARMDILTFAHNLSSPPTLMADWLEIEIRRLQRIGKLLQRLQEIDEKIKT